MVYSYVKNLISQGHLYMYYGNPLIFSSEQCNTLLYKKQNQEVVTGHWKYKNYCQHYLS